MACCHDVFFSSSFLSYSVLLHGPWEGTSQHPASTQGSDDWQTLLEPALLTINLLPIGERMRETCFVEFVLVARERINSHWWCQSADANGSPQKRSTFWSSPNFSWQQFSGEKCETRPGKEFRSLTDNASLRIHHHVIQKKSPFVFEFYIPKDKREAHRDVLHNSKMRQSTYESRGNIGSSTVITFHESANHSADTCQNWDSFKHICFR